MKLGLIGTLVLVPSVAAAEHPFQAISPSGLAPEYGFVGAEREDGLVFSRQVLPPSEQVPVVEDRAIALAQSRIIYLNKNGVTLSPGNNDARINRSTIVSQQTSIPAWNVSAANWQATVTCMRDLFAPFDVQVVEADPGNVPHMEAVFGGSPTQVGLPNNVAGVSPFTLDCSVIENSVVFTFTGAFQFTPREACEIMAQEVAHSYGLDHELLASDPMTYLQYNGDRSFKDQDASCGESTPRNCGINGSVCFGGGPQNSVKLLRERLGVSDPIAPTMSWTSPSDGATVPPGFEVKASGTDNIAVTAAVLRIDGTEVETLTGPGPYTFTTPSTLAEGSHTVVVEISDGKNLKSETRTVTVKKGAPPPDEDGGTGGGTGGEEDPFANGDVVGGCSTGSGHAGALLGLLLLGLVIRRRA